MLLATFHPSLHCFNYFILRFFPHPFLLHSIAPSCSSFLLINPHRFRHLHPAVNACAHAHTRNTHIHVWQSPVDNNKFKCSCFTLKVFLWRWMLWGKKSRSYCLILCVCVCVCRAPMEACSSWRPSSPKHLEKWWPFICIIRRASQHSSLLWPSTSSADKPQSEVTWPHLRYRGCDI